MRPFFRRPLPRLGWRMCPPARAAMARPDQAQAPLEQGQYLPVADAVVKLDDLGQARPGRFGRLPATRLFCGGTIHPETVEWSDESSATCDYCGSVVQAEARSP